MNIPRIRASHRRMWTRPDHPLGTIYLALALVSTLALPGCSGPTNPATECLPAPLPPAPDALVLAVSTHANAPAPGLPDTVIPTLQATLAANRPIRIVAIDGQPTAQANPPATNVATATCDAYKTSLAQATNQVLARVRSLKATTAGNNLTAAITTSANIVHANRWRNATIVVLDSGLAETGGSIRFDQPGMTTAAPTEVAATAAPSLGNLTGLRFTLVGFGSTSPPQPPLSGTEQANVTAIWKTTLTAAGAMSVTVDPTPRPDTGPTTPLPTKTAPTATPPVFAPPAPRAATTTVYPDSQLQFQPNSTALADPTTARAVLAPLITWLATDQRRHAHIVGTTAGAGTETGRLTLSKARATTIATLIHATNPAISATQLTTDGLGTNFPGYINDHNPDGTLNPATAALNRTVRITTRNT